MSRVERGAIVVHPRFGRGTVKDLKNKGFEALVRFTRLTIWVPVSELQPTGHGIRLIGEQGTENSEPAPRPSVYDIIRMLIGKREESGAKGNSGGQAEPRYRGISPKWTVAAHSDIEAFRLGIVPSSRVEEWTVGRDDEIQRLREFLENEAEGAILIEGAYGAGKTHLLQFLALQARRLGFAVAVAGFDPSEVAAAFPKRVYRNLLRGFSAIVGHREVDFRGFMWELAKSGKWREVLSGHWAFEPFLTLLEKDNVEESEWAWLEGRDGSVSYWLPTLHDHTTCANIYCNLLSGLSRAAAHVFDLRGLAILLDEAEVAQNVIYSYQFYRGLNFFRGLIMTANDDPVLIEERVNRHDDVYRGEISRLIYSGHRPVRYTSGVPSLLKVAFALTPKTLSRELKNYRDSMDTLSLKILPASDLRRLFGRICDRFCEVYGVNLTTTERERVYRLVSRNVLSTREFIKATVEALDALRFYPHVPLEQLLEAEIGS